MKRNLSSSSYDIKNTQTANKASQNRTLTGGNNYKNRNIRKRNNKKSNSSILFGLFVFVVFVVILVFSISNCKKAGGKNSNSNSGSLESNDSISQSNSNQSVVVTIDPENFWGNKIDLSSVINPVITGNRLNKWPDTTGFKIKSNDISGYLGKAKQQGALSGIIIVLDPGHGGVDLGAVFPRAPIRPEIIESRINLNVAFSIKSNLEMLGAKVYLTREDDTYDKLYYRSAFAAKISLSDFLAKISESSNNKAIITEYINKMEYTLKANDDKDNTGWFYGLGVRREIKNIFDIQKSQSNILFLSLHCNSSDKPDTLHGTKVYYSSNKAVYDDELKTEKDKIYPEYQSYDDASREKFASLLYRNIIKDNPSLIPTDSNNTIVARNYSVIREQNLVSALIEMGYVNNKTDRALLLNEDKQKELANSITNAIYEYYCKK